MLNTTVYSATRSSTTNTAVLPMTEEQEKWLFILQFACLLITCVVGTIGNAFICLVLYRAKRKSSDYFILNLATTDFLVCAIGIPLDIYEQQRGDTWPYGKVACHVIYPSQTLLVLVSIMTLTAMSLERYRAIITPLKRKLGKKVIMASIFLIWSMGFGIVVPYSRVLTYDGVYCFEQWPGENHGNYYTLALFIIDYCIPLTIIAYCYSRASYSLHMSCGSFDGKEQHSAMKKRLDSNKRVIKTFSLAVIVFVICMLPGDVYWMWVSFGDTSSFAYEGPLRTFTNIMLYANSAINPFIFGACCRNRSKFVFRRGNRSRTRTMSDTTKSTMTFRSNVFKTMSVKQDNLSKATLSSQKVDDQNSNVETHV